MHCYYCTWLAHVWGGGAMYVENSAALQPMYREHTSLRKARGKDTSLAANTTIKKKQPMLKIVNIILLYIYLLHVSAWNISIRWYSRTHMCLSLLNDLKWICFCNKFMSTLDYDFSHATHVVSTYTQRNTVRHLTSVSSTGCVEVKRSTLNIIYTN
jgi:hypothetical protein